MTTLNVSKFGETFDSGNAEPSQGILGRCRGQTLTT